MKAAGVLLALGLGLVVAWWFSGRGERSQPPAKATESSLGAGRALPAHGGETPSVRLIEENPFIEKYGEAGGSISADLKALRDVVRDCQLIFKDFDRYHLPGNAGITGFLQGENPDRLAWIPPGHRFVDEKGELQDRFGTPVFFHRLSGMRFEYRSAGPDRNHWTDDDVVVK